ncbi:MAG: helicase-exonuclease AddAB subunit AddA [Agathobacter sp.]|nr:helicase-exonuclease AddAB subunit AddA [Agathobacter sp.]
MKWTKEQQQVIDLRNRNILVSAAAGSGKTAVLVERIIQKITDRNHPVDIDKLLVVTFTKAAAAEMRERIGNAIEILLEEYPEDENLRKQQTLIHNAQITTIDSFCLFVVRNHFEEIGLEPNFRIADQGEIKLLEMDVLNEVFEQEFLRAKEETSDGRFLQLIDAYSDKRSHKAIKDMVYKIYSQSSSSPWPKEWIASLVEPYKVDNAEELLNTQLMQGIFSYVKAMLMDMPVRLEKLRAIALEPDGPTKYADTISVDLESFEGLDEINDFEALGMFCSKLEASMKGLTAIRNFTGNAAKKDAVSGGRNTLKKEIKDMRERYFSMSLEELVQQLKRMRPIAQELVRLASCYLEAMEQKKEEKHLMDFSDIEHAALRILVDEETKELRSTAFELKKQFEEIMIDEYQDSNQVQEEIMCAISLESEGRYNMFMVGDVKQSIYRFRLARPELFMEKYATYELKDSNKQRIDLHKNFRSRKEVLDFTNDMFYKIMDMDLGNVAYNEDVILNLGADYPESSNMKAEVLLFELEPEDGQNQSWEEDSLTKRQLEARMIAEKIIEMKKTLQITDKKTGELRAVKNSDIVILLRSLTGWGNDFVSVLEDCGIPAHVSTSTGYFSAIEVQTVLAFLKILDNPYQDIPMAAILKSPIVGLDNEELAEISLTEECHSFAEAALKQMDVAEEGKLYQFAQMYHRLRKKVMDTPIHHLLEMVLEETGYGDYVKALPAGSQRKANLDMLVEKAIAYEKTSYKGLFHFVRYIDQLQKYEVDFGEADVTGENEDVVRLMTIHKSKGLEFPVVFVAGISKQFNEMDSRDKMAIHPDMGLGLDEVQILPRTKRKCLLRSEIADRIRRDNLGEELRVLYVALTRAKEKLILTGTVKNREKIFESYSGNITPKQALSFSQRVKAKSYLDWIAPAIMSYPEKYTFEFRTPEDLVLAEVEQRVEELLSKQELLEQIANADETLVKTFQENFAYEYPYEQEKNKKSKYSVSELKHASMVEKYDRMEGLVEIPDFLQEERESYVPVFAQKLTLDEDTDNTQKDNASHKKELYVSGVNRGALRGTAVHRVMECLNFKKILEVDISNDDAIEVFLEQEIACMLEKEQLTKEMCDLVSIKKLIDYVKNPVAIRMARADASGDLFREKPFVMDYKGMLLQGIIDVFWLEDEKIVVLDYKTDRIQVAEELITRYKTQLDLYADALCRIFSTKESKIESAEKLIYSFSLDEVIEIK